jgi:hypothetical protein
MEKWWNKPLRAITLEFPASDVANIDVKGIIAETGRGSVNMLNVFCTGYYPGGTAFYQSKIAPHYPGLGSRDLLAESIEAGHATGQKIIAYIAAIWGNRDLYEAHPDWAQRKADGRVTSWDEQYTSVAFCPNSPYRDYLNLILKEIIDNYEVDGFYFDEPSFQSWCSCENCKKKFFDEFHEPLPVEEKWDDPTFANFITWRYKQISDWRNSLYQAAKGEDRCIFFQVAFPLARLSKDPVKISGLQFNNPYVERFGVDWYVPMAHAADVSYTSQIEDVVHFELYRRSVHEPLWWYGVNLRYGQRVGHGKQILVLNMMAQTPFDLYGLPEAELRLSVAELLANNGSPMFARYYPDRVDQQAWNQVYDCLQEARLLEPYLEKRESLKYAALLFSETTLEHNDKLEGKPSHLDCMKGMAKALLQEQILFDVITEDELDDGLKQYQALILPNVSCLPAQAKQAIRSFVDAGGGIIGSYETGMFDEHGCRSENDDFSTLFGVQYVPTPPMFFGFDVYMNVLDPKKLGSELQPGKLVPTGGIQIEVILQDAAVIARTLAASAVHYGPIGSEAGPAAVLAHEGEGRGRSVYFTMPIGNRYLEFGVEAQRELISSAVKWVARGFPQVRVANAPKTLALTAFDQPGENRLIVHLVNSVLDEVLRPIYEVPETRNVDVKIEMKSTPKKVVVWGETHEPEWSMEVDTLIIHLPEFRYRSILLVEY